MGNISPSSKLPSSLMYEPAGPFPENLNRPLSREERSFPRTLLAVHSHEIPGFQTDYMSPAFPFAATPIALSQRFFSPLLQRVPVSRLFPRRMRPLPLRGPPFFRVDNCHPRLAQRVSEKFELDILCPTFFRIMRSPRFKFLSPPVYLLS